MQPVLTEKEVDLLLEAIDDRPVKDNLTGLYNRKAFDKRFKYELDHAKEMDQILSFVFLDIDYFTRVNADFGHEAGDKVLKLVTRIIDEVEEKLIASRYGGEEFVLLFPDTEREQAFLIAEKIRGALDREHEILVSGKKEKSALQRVVDKKREQPDEEKTEEPAKLRKTVQIKLSISGGVAAYPTDGQNESEIIRKVDQALYRAKKTGRNKICIAQEEKMATKTTHYTLTQLERLATLSKEESIGEAVLLREALDDLLFKYKVSEVES